MQSQPLQSSGMDRHDLSLDLSAVPSLYRQMRDSIMGELSEFESMCIHFFLTELPVNLGIHHLFPGFLGSIFSSSLWSEGLRSMVLAVSAYLLDSRAGRPAIRAYKYMQQGIPLIQNAFSENIFDESLVFSLFLAAFLHQICGEIASSRHHLEGLHLLLQHHGAIPPNRKDCLPELMLVWRLAIQMDHTWAFGDQTLIFPLVEREDDIHRKWIEKLVDQSRPEMVDWALAQFALDDMLSWSIIIMKKANQLRSMSTGNSAKSELAINAEAAKLLRSHAGWMERPCIRSASDLAEYDPLNLYDTPSPSESPSLKPFPLSSNIEIKNRGFGALMIQYYWVLIYISFISQPCLGASPPERFDAAVNLCHIYETIGSKETFGVCRMVLGLYLTGLTLGEKEYSEGICLRGSAYRRICMGWRTIAGNR